MKKAIRGDKMVFGLEADCVAFVLAIGVCLVNGFTDAPSSIATVIATGTLSSRQACFISSVSNLVGLLVMSMLGGSVTKSVLSFVEFEQNAGIALCVTLLTVIVFSMLCWLFSMPSSESHALLCAIVGVSLAMSREVSLKPFLKILAYMLISTGLVIVLSIALSRATRPYQLPYPKLQVAGCVISSLMHGAQDGQKLVGIMLILGVGNAKSNHIMALFLVSIALFVGTMLGGGRISELMGNGIARLSQRSGVIADTASSICLLVCSLLGAPVSTSNVKAIAISASAYIEGEKINKRALCGVILVAIATIPCCVLISYAIARLVL